jgi:O-antigen/teichoic acid export membrane protein
VLSVAILFPAAIGQAAAVLKSQAAVIALGLPPLWVMVVLGPWIIELLYAPAFHGAGWMLQILAAGQIVATIVAARIPVLLARGDSRRHMLVQFTHSVFLLAALAAGGWRYGLTGAVAGIALANLLNYPVTVWATWKYNAWIPWLEAAGFGASAAVIGGGLWLL